MGSPAHAGIDRALIVLSVTRLRFPRTRGDRPRVYPCARRPCRVPPHTRG